MLETQNEVVDPWHVFTLNWKRNSYSMCLLTYLCFLMVPYDGLPQLSVGHGRSSVLRPVSRQMSMIVSNVNIATVVTH